MMRHIKQRQILLLILFVAVIPAALYYFSRPTVVGYIGPFSGASMTEGQDFFRGLNAGLQKESFFKRFKIVSMDINHSRREAAENVKHFVEQDSISHLWADFPKNREEELNKTLHAYSGHTHSVSQFVPSDGEVSVVIGDLIQKDLRASRLHIYYSEQYKKLLEVVKINLRSDGRHIEVTESRVEDLAKSKSIPLGTDTVLVLSNIRVGTQTLALLNKKSFAGRTVVLNTDSYFDFSSEPKKWQPDSYIVTLFDQEKITKLKQFMPDMNISTSVYSGFIAATNISKEKKGAPVEKTPPVFVSKISALTKHE